MHPLADRDLRAQIFHEAHFDILAVNVAIEIEQIDFENALGFSDAPVAREG